MNKDENPAVEIIYKGSRDPKSGNICVSKQEFYYSTQTPSKNPVLLDPAPSQKLYNHSPDGFEWGFNGSGPAQLALALLLDATGDGKCAVFYHQDFKADIVANWENEWVIKKVEVLAWVEMHNRGEQIFQEE
jgi:hypothetical protein